MTELSGAGNTRTQGQTDTVVEKLCVSGGKPGRGPWVCCGEMDHDLWTGCEGMVENPGHAVEKAPPNCGRVRLLMCV